MKRLYRKWLSRGTGEQVVVRAIRRCDFMLFWVGAEKRAREQWMEGR